MKAIAEGSILLASLVGHLSRTDEEGVYRFEHRLVAPTCTVVTYKNYLTERLQRFSAWPSSAGCAFEPVSDITALPDGSGFGVLVRAKASEFMQS